MLEFFLDVNWSKFELQILKTHSNRSACSSRKIRTYLCIFLLFLVEWYKIDFLQLVRYVLLL